MFSLFDVCSYYVRKGSWAFYLNYPQINEVRKSDHVGGCRQYDVFSHQTSLLFSQQTDEWLPRPIKHRLTEKLIVPGIR